VGGAVGGAGGGGEDPGPTWGTTEIEAKAEVVYPMVEWGAAVLSQVRHRKYDDER